MAGNKSHQKVGAIFTRAVEGLGGTGLSFFARAVTTKNSVDTLGTSSQHMSMRCAHDIKNRSKSRRGAERSAKVKVVASSNVSSSLFLTRSSEWTSRISSSKDHDHSDAAAAEI